MKMHSQVKWTRKNGEIGSGKLAKKETKVNGVWAHVKVPGQPKPSMVRLSQLTPV